MTPPHLDSCSQGGTGLRICPVPQDPVPEGILVPALCLEGSFLNESEIPLLPSAPLLTESSSQASQVDTAFLVYDEETEAGCNVAGFCSPASLWETAEWCGHCQC